MTGDIVACSPTVEPALFRYALCGFGRVGVIGEVEVGSRQRRVARGW